MPTTAATVIWVKPSSAEAAPAARGKGPMAPAIEFGSTSPTPIRMKPQLTADECKIGSWRVLRAPIILSALISVSLCLCGPTFYKGRESQEEDHGQQAGTASEAVDAGRRVWPLARRVLFQPAG